MVEEKREVTVKIPERIYDKLAKYAKLTGMSVHNQIYGAIVRWLIIAKIIDLDDVRNNGRKKPKIVSTKQSIPEEIKYCERDECFIDPFDNFKNH